MNAALQALKQKRLKWVESNRENGFDEGINRLLTELYPDNAHFIYELLQNAEDPQATTVQFKLTDSSVEFSHDGKRLFSFKDVESITSIGNSTKRDDATSIGKFGVGFKAVFAYTNTPEIHSGDFHFRICDLVVPDTEGVNRLVK
ncbi:sacsin N-terminal ATP-binding-like domain-containing protein, partial [Methylomonas koyamae]|uniref:sacsin N-terminal ATP-binding-like domain-containing protein n=1 Tax=Methylomonas koyamae TaxID=702114 RepID=UPI000A6CCE9C